jgi:hypothetical protein
LDRNRISHPSGLAGRSTICRWNCSRAVSVASTPWSSSTVTSAGSVIPGRPRSNWIDRDGPGSRVSTASPLVQVHWRSRPPSGGYQPVPQPIASRSRYAVSHGPSVRTAVRRHCGRSWSNGVGKKHRYAECADSGITTDMYVALTNRS